MLPEANLHIPGHTLDTRPNPGVERVIMRSDEVLGRCPITGRPDFERAEIEYVPDKLCLEAHSVKDYLQSFRDEPMFCEAFARRIADDVFATCKPLWVRVTVHQKQTEGAEIEVTAFRGDAGRSDGQ